MSIVILTGGSSEQGNPEQRYLVGQFLQRFGTEITRIITTRPVKHSVGTRLIRAVTECNYSERLSRACYPGGRGPDAQDIQRLLLPDEPVACMPGGERVSSMSSLNSDACRVLVQSSRPRIIVVYSTASVRPAVFSLASDITLNMHTGLSPYYRGDSTLFWPVYFNEPEHLGVTIQKLVETMDGADIAATAKVVYESGDSEAELFAKGVKAGTVLYLDVVEQALAGTLTCTPQDLSQGREFSVKDRTVASERLVLSQLQQWQSRNGAPLQARNPQG